MLDKYEKSLELRSYIPHKSLKVNKDKNETQSIKNTSTLVSKSYTYSQDEHPQLYSILFVQLIKVLTVLLQNHSMSPSFPVYKKMGPEVLSQYWSATRYRS